MTNPAGGRLTKNERREAAREKARQLREEHKRRERRNRFLIQGGVIVGSLAIVAVVALVIVNSVRPAGPGPQNMLSGGIRIAEGFEAVETAALRPGATPTPIPDSVAEPEGEGEAEAEEAAPINVQIFVDYLCPVCRAFEEANSEQIASLIESGAITYEVHPISFLDRLSLGTRYSSRAANAAACVAEHSPNSFWDFNGAMFANQPAENSAGLSDEEIVEIVAGLNPENADELEECIEDETFRAWVQDMTTYATNSGVPGTEVTTVRGTPTVIANGEQYEGAIDDPAAFAAFLSQVEGQVFNEESSPSPTPTPTPES